jgi:hypothetical protein
MLGSMAPPSSLDEDLCLFVRARDRYCKCSVEHARVTVGEVTNATIVTNATTIDRLER